MRFPLGASSERAPLESHSHIPPRNATLCGESPSYSATSGDPKPKNYCGCERDRPVMSDGYVSTTVGRLQYFFLSESWGTRFVSTPRQKRGGLRDGCYRNRPFVGLLARSLQHSFLLAFPAHLLANVHHWQSCRQYMLFEAGALSFAQTEKLIGCAFGGSIDLTSVNWWHTVLFPGLGRASVSYATLQGPLLLEREPFMPRVGEVKWDLGHFPQSEGLFSVGEEGKEKKASPNTRW